MVKIRLKRMGAKKAPFYRVVVADSRFPRDGRFIEQIGYYNPMTDPAEIVIDSEKANSWIANGAQPTETVRRLLKKAGTGTVAAPAAAEAGAEPAAAEAAAEPAAAEAAAEPAAGEKVSNEADIT